MYKISQEDYADLHSVLSHPGYKILIKELSNLVEDQAQTLIKTQVGSTDPNQILWLKAKHEGAEKLLRDLDTRMKKIFNIPQKDDKKNGSRRNRLTRID